LEKYQQKKCRIELKPLLVFDFDYVDTAMMMEEFDKLVDEQE
jgi:hypothetical protein